MTGDSQVFHTGLVRLRLLHIMNMRTFRVVSIGHAGR